MKEIQTPCKHMWGPAKDNIVICAKCGEHRFKCERPGCDHTWVPLVADPVTCPRCKSYKWREPKKCQEK